MKVQEELITHICKTLVKERYSELKLFGREPQDLLKIKPPFPRLTYKEVVKLLNEKSGKDAVNIEYGEDLTYEHEKVVAVEYKIPFFITGYPKTAKAFYHKVDPDDPELTLSTDLLAPEGYGEITGGGQRIHDLEELINRIKDDGLNIKDYNWYIDLRRYGSIPHSGFGLGIERTLAWICKLKHIRDAIAFPRLINRVYP
jgi:asparaginyl-tRNA synthetase